ncbi:Nramp family divalent metal transporter [Actinomycetospora termitidis]|uniref:Nramp family divalent metal transporter n=1 Tax=Actinomycetospora termitidis TaxID=3053470 RepID=A0ABT7MI53_9PSEU|nr:Nramp family divalent metal transporter [Actinomycetospora sp. Odt1-22]MDL5160357.1 Nramp family divalent metal transporter [Actinomycetospora sp. Odt1-22]
MTHASVQQDPAEPLEPPTGAARLRSLGPGILAAAAGVGAGDLVATMVAGAEYGTALLWAALVGTGLKLALGEGVGRWHLASGSTLLDGWRRLGRWATGFFAVYIVIWGFVYGATAMSAVGLPLNALFGGLSVRYWAMIAGVVGLALVWAQRYQVFEKFVTVLVALKFVTVVSVAILVTPNLGDLASGLVPRLPEGSTVYVLGLVGGVGGTITMAAYGYWMFAKGWKGTGWLSMMRLDNAVGYVMTGIFVVAMLIVGSTLLLGQDLTESDRGLLTLGEVLGTDYGQWARILFLVGFLAVTTSSLLGVWNGVSLLFADTLRTLRLPHGKAADTVGAEAAVEGEEGERGAYEAATVERSWPFRAYLLWLTVPPMVLLFIDRPFALTLVYGVLGSVFMPFLAITLMLLLNSGRVAAGGRSGWLSNTLLGASSVLFLALLVTDVAGRLG